MRTVLVIDRRKRTRYELGIWLGANDRVIAVGDVFLAFNYLRTRRFDTVVVKTTSLDGIAIAILNWLQLRGMGVPVVVLLGAAAAADMPRIRSLGASAVVRWPASRASLLEAVASARPIGDSELRSSPAAIRETETETETGTFYFSGNGDILLFRKWKWGQKRGHSTFSETGTFYVFGEKRGQIDH